MRHHEEAHRSKADGAQQAIARGVIFDLDGTLVDTNTTHVDAWVEGFQACGFDIPAERVRPEVGQGGDKVVPVILGDDVNARQGDAIRDAVSKAFRRLAAQRTFAVFPGAVDLLRALRARGVQCALATSAAEDDLHIIADNAGLALKELFDVVVTRSDVDASKPDPDVIHAALEKLGLAPGECVMVGDTEYDVTSAARAGVRSVGVLSGGLAAPEEERGKLEAAGAVRIWTDVGAIVADLDELLSNAPGSGA